MFTYPKNGGVIFLKIGTKSATLKKQSTASFFRKAKIFLECLQNKAISGLAITLPNFPVEGA